MSSNGEDLIRSDWTERPMTGAEYASKHELSRLKVVEPVVSCYQAIASRYIPATGNILCLGIGTGQVETMMGLVPDRLTGIDINGSFLSVAKGRLPKATLVQRDFADALQAVEPVPIVLAHDSLDTIHPRRLISFLTQLREKAGRVIITHIFTPDPTFYAFHSTENSGSYGGPGIEGWLPEQHALVTQYLAEHGIVFPLTLDALCGALDTFMEREGIPLGVRLLDGIARAGFSGEFTNMTVRNIAELSRFLEELQEQTDAYRSGDSRFTYPPVRSQRERDALFTRMYSLASLAGILKSYFHTRIYLLILEDALKQAGFTIVDHNVVAAEGTQQIPAVDVSMYLNRGLSSLMSFYSGFPDPTTFSGRGFVYGGNWLTQEPQGRPFTIATVHCLVAE